MIRLEHIGSQPPAGIDYQYFKIRMSVRPIVGDTSSPIQAISVSVSPIRTGNFDTNTTSSSFCFKIIKQSLTVSNIRHK